MGYNFYAEDTQLYLSFNSHSVGMIKLILSLRLNPVLGISTVGCLVTNLS